LPWALWFSQINLFFDCYIPDLQRRMVWEALNCPCFFTFFHVGFLHFFGVYIYLCIAPLVCLAFSRCPCSLINPDVLHIFTNLGFVFSYVTGSAFCISSPFFISFWLLRRYIFSATSEVLIWHARRNYPLHTLSTFHLLHNDLLSMLLKEDAAINPNELVCWITISDHWYHCINDMTSLAKSAHRHLCSVRTNRYHSWPLANFHFRTLQYLPSLQEAVRSLYPSRVSVFHRTPPSAISLRKAENWATQGWLRKTWTPLSALKNEQSNQIVKRYTQA
jgi:hypothetical protein